MELVCKTRMPEEATLRTAAGELLRRRRRSGSPASATRGRTRPCITGRDVQRQIIDCLAAVPPGRGRSTPCLIDEDQWRLGHLVDFHSFKEGIGYAPPIHDCNCRRWHFDRLRICHRHVFKAWPSERDSPNLSRTEGCRNACQPNFRILIPTPTASADIGMEVSGTTMFKASIADWLAGWLVDLGASRHCWMPGIAAIMSRFKKT